MSLLCICSVLFFFFFNDTATTEIYTLSLHDALPISAELGEDTEDQTVDFSIEYAVIGQQQGRGGVEYLRSEEHTSELQSRQYLVCRLLLEKKKKITMKTQNTMETLTSEIHYSKITNV